MSTANITHTHKLKHMHIHGGILPHSGLTQILAVLQMTLTSASNWYYGCRRLCCWYCCFCFWLHAWVCIIHLWPTDCNQRHVIHLSDSHANAWIAVINDVQLYRIGDIVLIAISNAIHERLPPYKLYYHNFVSHNILCLSIGHYAIVFFS